MSDAELFDDFGLEPVEDGLMSPIISTQNSEDQSSTLAPSSSTPVRRSEHHDARFRKKTFRERTQQRMNDMDSSSESESDSTVPIIRKKSRVARDDDLTEMKQLLKKLCNKVESNERVLKELQKNQDILSSTVSTDQESGKSSPDIRKKHPVPNFVRKEVRKVYGILEEEDENFEGWTIMTGKNFKSRENQAVLSKLVSEVKGLNPSFGAADIREAAYRFYRTKCEEESAKRRGTEGVKKTTKRRHERIVRKRKERTSALMKNSKLTEQSRQKWLQVMVNDMMSSEESGEDDMVVVHPISWRTDYVNKMFHSIDNYCKARKSAQARRQMKQRITGSESGRVAPTDMPSWAVKTS